MDIGLREWLVICGVIVVLLVILDGARRYFGRNTLKLKLDRKLINQFSEEPHNPEIISPVRVVKPKEPYLGESELEDEDEDLSQRQGSLYLEEPSQASLDGFEFDMGEDDEDGSDLLTAEEEEARPVEYEEILIIYVESLDIEGFKGPDLLQCILESGMRFGEMEIFHRYESMASSGDKLFSMANALKPGIFDLDNMDDFSTRAVCFFMSLPGPKQPKQTFDLMLNAARKLARELGGELKDDHRSDLTTQTVEHYRQKVMEFERRQMMTRSNK